MGGSLPFVNCGYCSSNGKNNTLISEKGISRMVVVVVVVVVGGGGYAVKCIAVDVGSRGLM